MKANLRSIEGTLASYVAGALNAAPPAATLLKARMHLLDTLTAILIGRFLPAGQYAYPFAESMGGSAEATLVGSDKRVGAVHAAMANGMAAHADETDDSHAKGRLHPGCATIPAALAMAERQGRSFDDLLRAIILGYDIGARANIALGYESPKTSRHSTHSLGPLFGAAVAAGALAGLTEPEARMLLAYAVQQASGVPCWARDADHVEKAFDFGGMGARDGIYAALMAKAGFTGVLDPLTGPRGYLDAFAERPDPDALIDGLGERFEIDRASIKKWSVGSPIQSVLDAIEILLRDPYLDVAKIVSVGIELPSNRFQIVDNRDMPAICVQHLAAAMLIKGGLSFEEAHDLDLMKDPKVLAMRAKIKATPNDALTHASPERQSIVTIRMTDGAELRHHARVVHGTPEYPMSVDDVANKACKLLATIPLSGADRLIEMCLAEDGFMVSNLTAAARSVGAHV